MSVFKKGYTLSSASATRRLAETFSRKLGSGDIVLLKGPLGAGKTFFVKAVCRSLGCRALVKSPTFKILNCYAVSEIPIFHFDFYRLKTSQEALDIGFLEYLHEKKGILFIEWPDKITGLLPSRRKEIELEITGPGKRRIMITEKG